MCRRRQKITVAALYGIIDAARDPRLYPMVAVASEHVSLFAGELKPPLERVAPYLVRLDPEAELTTAWHSQGWGKSWGILCLSSLSLSELRKHFRQFLQASLSDGQVGLFRYYDPRVFRAYLPTCEARDLAAWFVGIDEFRVESADGQGVHFLRLRENRLEVGGTLLPPSPIA